MDNPRLVVYKSEEKNVLERQNISYHFLYTMVNKKLDVKYIILSDGITIDADKFDQLMLKIGLAFDSLTTRMKHAKGPLTEEDVKDVHDLVLANVVGQALYVPASTDIVLDALVER